MSSGTGAVFPNCPKTIRTFEVGGLTTSELIFRLTARGVSMNEQARRLLAHDRFAISPACYTLRTVELRGCDLGLRAGAISAEIYRAASGLGLAVCPLEMGPFMRLQYLDQPEGERVTVASARISRTESVPNGFYLQRRGDGLWLRGYTASDDYEWDPEERFLFRLTGD